jgi:hypothetical protein
VDRVAARLDQTVRVSLLESAHVEAPVVIGWSRVSLILPSGITARLAPDLITPLVAHEFAHIRRRDYVVNYVQSILELPLFFSPAVVWMSRRIRELREYCCDDAAVDGGVDPRHYIDALTTLASLATINTVRPALGAAGPRLIVRVRRLVEGERMPKYTFVRVTGLVVSFVLLAVVGSRVLLASAAHVSRLSMVTRSSPVGSRQDRIPFGYGTPDGSGVELSHVVSTADQPVERATVTNITIEPISAIRLVAVVERFSTPSTSALLLEDKIPRLRPVQLFASELLPVWIGPGASTDIFSPPVLSAQQLQALAAPGDRLQLFISVQEVKFANGAEWRITPNPAAADHREALAFGRAEIPRELLGVAPNTGASRGTTSLCLDQNQKGFSQGAIIGIRNEPGRLARCNNGRWEETAGR